MPKFNLSRWINQITTFSRQGLHKQALRLFNQLQPLGFKPNPFTIPSLLRSCAHLSNLKAGRTLHNLIIQSLLTSDPFISSALIDLYSKCGDLETALKVFGETPERDLVVWNAMVSGYTRLGFAEKALVLVVKMQFRGMKPDSFTWNTLISGFSQLGNDEMALDLFRLMKIDGIEPDVFSWTSIVSGFVQNFKYDKAFEVLRQMVVLDGIKPSSVTQEYECFQI